MRELDAGWAETLLIAHLHNSPQGTGEHNITIRGPLSTRIYSRVFRVESSALPTPAVLKVCLQPHTSRPDKTSARQQFGTLQRLSESGSGQTRGLAPRPYLLIEDEGALLAEWIPGHNMAWRLFSWRCRPAEALGLTGEAAQWLRRFHDVQPDGQGPLDVEDKLSMANALAKKGLRGNPIYEGCLACLSKHASQAAAIPLKRSLVHGDFKAGNLLMNDGDAVGIDIHAAANNVVIYDIAQFLNDIDTSPRFSWRGSGALARRLREHFIACYFGENHQEVRLPLLWIRAYIYLSQWHTSRTQFGHSLRGRAHQHRYKTAIRRIVSELDALAR
jgi:hypothetical protein